MIMIVSASELENIANDLALQDYMIESGLSKDEIDAIIEFEPSVDQLTLEL